jgi:hypothetical protein
MKMFPTKFALIIICEFLFFTGIAQFSTSPGKRMLYKDGKPFFGWAILRGSFFTGSAVKKRTAILRRAVTKSIRKFYKKCWLNIFRGYSV